MRQVGAATLPSSPAPLGRALRPARSTGSRFGVAVGRPTRPVTMASASSPESQGSRETTTPKSPTKVLIAGAGVIGSSIAYHLALRGVRATLYDRAGPAAAASGKAGGFLALDWCDGTPVGPLARKSFAMHEELARTLGMDSYRRLTCEAVALDERVVHGQGGVPKPGNKKLEAVQWADVGAVASRTMGTEETVAQVHPARLTEALLRGAKDAAGSEVVLGSVEGIAMEEGRNDGNDGKKAVGLVVDGKTVEADVVVIAMGPWTAAARSWASGAIKLPPIYGQKYHAVLMRPERVLSQAVFFQGLGDPEFYPRPDGDVYVCGFPDAPEVVTETPGAVEVRPEAVQRLVNVARQVSSEMAAAEVNGSGQSCHLPVTADGVPVMGAVPGVEGAYVATGHSCWGILNSPASGAAMAELIVDGRVTVVEGFEAFSPARFGSV